MPIRSGKSNIADLELIQEIIEQRDAAYKALAQARREAAGSYEEIGRLQAQLAEARQAETTATAPDFEPGQAPINDLAAWRRGQLGL